MGDIRMRATTGMAFQIIMQDEQFMKEVKYDLNSINPAFSSSKGFFFRTRILLAGPNIAIEESAGATAELSCLQNLIREIRLARYKS
jgi:hypothetical protein